jgi:hypothetical protein
VSGQVLQRSQGLGVSAPRVVSSYLSGMKLGEIGNDGTDNIDFATAVNAQATARGTGAFRGGATSATAYADFDQSYASVTPGSMAPVAGSITAQGGDSFASLATRLWGDASLWYLLAEANPGLATGPSGALSAGQAITVPNKVSRNSGDTDTNSGNTIRIPPSNHPHRISIGRQPRIGGQEYDPLHHRLADHRAVEGVVVAQGQRAGRKAVFARHRQFGKSPLAHPVQHDVGPDHEIGAFQAVLDRDFPDVHGAEQDFGLHIFQFAKCGDGQLIRLQRQPDQDVRIEQQPHWGASSPSSSGP